MDKVKLATFVAFVLSLGLAGSAIFAGGRVAEVLYSPGPIHREHQDAACATCHTPFKGVKATGCESGNCHSPGEFADAEPAVAAAHRGPEGEDCVACHTDHRGRDGRITLAYHRDVPGGLRGAIKGDCERCHEQEGRDAHPDLVSAAGCDSCHTSTKDWDVISFDHFGVARQACTDCHRAPDRDFHADMPVSAVSSCEACHGTDAWEPADFDHDLLPPAVGGLNEVGSSACADCHGPEGEEAHPDVALENCAVCHTSTSDWEEVNVDHAEVRELDCTSCHSAPEDTLHAGLQTACERCHGAEAWEPATFDHDVLSTGARQSCQDCHGGEGARAHPGIRSESCGSCHTSTSDWERYRFSHAEVKGEACTACHSTPRGSLHANARGLGCEQCHGTSRWEPSTFRHPRIPEYWEHMEKVGCADCHPSSLRESVTCESCHRGGRYDDDDEHREKEEKREKNKETRWRDIWKDDDHDDDHDDHDDDD